MMSHRDATKSPLYQLPVSVIHEGVPGHHFQISRTQENEELPEFRREARVTALIDGGPMPLAMLNRYMDQWIAAQAK
ncbi:DUF885 family protein [Altererythrobacter sp. FM1]|nr:DUF885 family protein [Altererythrobacter sp. FM1]